MSVNKKSKSLTECRRHISHRNTEHVVTLKFKPHLLPNGCSCDLRVPGAYSPNVWELLSWSSLAARNTPCLTANIGHVSCCDNTTPTPLVGQEAKSWGGWWTLLFKVILCSMKNTSLHAPFYKNTWQRPRVSSKETASGC